MTYDAGYPYCAEYGVMQKTIENQQAALRSAKEYIEAQPRNEVSAHVLAIIDGVLTSPDYVP